LREHGESLANRILSAPRGKTEVEDLGAAIGCAEKVGGFQIAVNHIFAVGCIQRVTYFDRSLQQFGQCDRPRQHPITKALAFQ
jgi:hypothetical protein